MIRSLFLIMSALCVLLGAPALAGGGGGDDKAKKASAEPVTLYDAIKVQQMDFQKRFGEDETCPRNLDIPILILPVTVQDRLKAYSFVVPRVCLTKGNQYDYIKKVHFLTDAIVKASHRVPVQIDEDGQLDYTETNSEIVKAISQFISEDKIDRVDLIERDIRVF